MVSLGSQKLRYFTRDVTQTIYIPLYTNSSVCTCDFSETRTHIFGYIVLFLTIHCPLMMSWELKISSRALIELKQKTRLKFKLDALAHKKTVWPLLDGVGVSGLHCKHTFHYLVQGAFYLL